MFSIILLLSFLGISDSLYLIYKNRPSKTLVCPINGNCHAVLESKWNKFLGVKNEIWGLLYYFGIIGLAILFITNFILLEILLSAVSFGFLYSAFLTYIQFAKLKAYCFYCLVSATINLLLFLAVLFMYYSSFII